MKIGFIGVGVMGNGMVKNLCNRAMKSTPIRARRAKALEALDAGAVWRENVADCVRDADAVISIVGFPPDVEEVYFGDKGILANRPPRHAGHRHDHHQPAPGAAHLYRGRVEGPFGAGRPCFRRRHGARAPAHCPSWSAATARP